MRYVVETYHHSVSRTEVSVVERVFVTAGSRQYTTVECDIMPAGFKRNGTDLKHGLRPNKLIKSVI